MEKKKTMLLVDGSSMLTADYWGSCQKKKDETEESLEKRLPTIDGRFVNGVKLTIERLIHIINRYKPDYTAVAFDYSRQTTLRRKMCEDYKGQREASPRALKEQFQTAKEILQAIGIPVFQDEEYEADDIVASFVQNYKNDVDNIILVSRDHDYFQLVEDGVDLWLPCKEPEQLAQKYGCEKELSLLPAKMFRMNEERILGEEGVMPKQIPDLKALKGDTSDNIKGVKGISSAAAPLLREYGTIEGIYNALDQDEKGFERKIRSLGIRPVTIKQLKEGRDSAYMCKKLATMMQCQVVPLQQIATMIDYNALRNVEKMYGFHVATEKSMPDYICVAVENHEANREDILAGLREIVLKHPKREAYRMILASDDPISIDIARRAHLKTKIVPMELEGTDLREIAKRFSKTCFLVTAEAGSHTVTEL